jgi:hypothetical protein
MSIELATLVGRNISGFITYSHTSSSKVVVCGRSRSMRGRETDRVQRPRAITPSDHIPGSKILHR